MSNVEILGRPKYQPIKFNIKEDKSTFYDRVRIETIKGKVKTSDSDLIYERFENQDRV